MTTSWTDDPLKSTDDAPPAHNPRKVHIDELRTVVNAELVRRSVPVYNFTDPTLTPNVTHPRAVHVNELRAAVDSGIGAPSCTSDTMPPPAWEDNPVYSTDDLTPTLIRARHIQQLRQEINLMESQCMCDCHGYCGCHGDCGCNGHCSNEGCETKN